MKLALQAAGAAIALGTAQTPDNANVQAAAIVAKRNPMTPQSVTMAPSLTITATGARPDVAGPCMTAPSSAEKREP